MTQTDIAFLLADAADEVEVGIAPVQAVMRGGRRRRARRWAVAAATALVLAGSTGGTLALTGLPGGHGDKGASVATQPASPEARHVYEPQYTEIAWGNYRGREWSVGVWVWGAPRNAPEAMRQFSEMSDRGLRPPAFKAVELIGRTSYMATSRYGTDRNQDVLHGTGRKLKRMTGTHLEAATTFLGEFGDSKNRHRLVVGMVAKSAREVTCHWKDGTSSVARGVPADSAARAMTPKDAAIRPVDGFPTANWFVCVAPEGTSYDPLHGVEVTK
ncbi:hypothetical protein [Streptomyces sp. NPDC058964]|uniref:hypothetical protein n=1 Tax=Streptomyces sp. NPDC058964 TaxID=3346681 RepID=UPI0036B36198